MDLGVMEMKRHFTGNHLTVYNKMINIKLNYYYQIAILETILLGMKIIIFISNDNFDMNKKFNLENSIFADGDFRENFW